MSADQYSTCNAGFRDDKYIFDYQSTKTVSYKDDGSAHSLWEARDSTSAL